MNYNRFFDFLEKYEMRLLPLSLMIPVLLLLSLLFQPLITMQFGETIILQTQPIDPTDLFRGDYVDLFYDINQIDSSKTKIEGLKTDSAENTLNGKTVYVQFKKGAQTHIVDRFTMIKPQKGPYLKGKILSNYLKDYNIPNSPRIYNMNFGIDRYFIEENSGKGYEDAARTGKVIVTLKIYNGYAVVSGLEIEK